MDVRCWYYQHVVSHHVSTNQDNENEKDVDVVPRRRANSGSSQAD